MSISVLGAGAFGTSLALTLARDGSAVVLWARDTETAAAMQASRKTGDRLPGHDLPLSLAITSDRSAFDADICLIAVPMQQLASFLSDATFRESSALVVCCKGVDRNTGLGPVATVRAVYPGATAAILTGPSFAADIALGLPTALVIATARDEDAAALQSAIGRSMLRLYRSTDVIGAELGGALKNVIALAAGIAIGAGLGDSARASVIARGFAEMNRYATAKGAKPETIHGLSGLGDLVLTCTSEKSRNFSTGIALGRGGRPDPGKTVEGIATASALAAEAKREGHYMPLTQAVAAVTEGRLDIPSAIETLLARPAGKE